MGLPTPRARAAAAPRSPEASTQTARPPVGGSSTAPPTRTGHQTPATDIGQGTAPVAVTGYLSGLGPATAYHYRLVAQNSLGTTYGYDYSFKRIRARQRIRLLISALRAGPAPSSTTAFDARTSSDDGASITDYTWDFGDGHTVDAGPRRAPPATSTPRPGTYNVTLIVTSSNGASSDSATQQVTVDNPTASFTAPQLVAPGDQCPSTPPARPTLGTITDYSWDFGDQSPPQPVDTGTNPITTHTFARGTYTVTLTITNDLGQQVQVSHNMTVDTAPTASFTAPTGIQNTTTSLSFDGRASTASDPGTIEDYTWDFGDGTVPVDTHTSPMAGHTYNAPNQYAVTLTVTDDLGVTNTTTQTVTVDHPKAAFALPATPAPGAPANFDASSSSDSRRLDHRLQLGLRRRERPRDGPDRSARVHQAAALIP